jgi:hypothetical protein
LQTRGGYRIRRVFKKLNERIRDQFRSHHDNPSVNAPLDSVKWNGNSLSSIPLVPMWLRRVFRAGSDVTNS